MHKKLHRCVACPSGHPIHLAALLLALPLTLGTTGCLSSLARHSAALSAATTPVVDQAAVAYHAADAVYDLRVDYDAVSEFDRTDLVYNPRLIDRLLSEHDIHIRLAVLNAFQCYARTLVEITSGKESPQLDAASKSVGATLTGLGNSIAPSIESTFNIASKPASTSLTTVVTTTGNATTTTTSSGSTAAPAISPATQKAISTAAEALGKFLVDRKIRKELPGKIREMDPHLQALCELLEHDIGIIQDQEKRDFDGIINRQTLFIRLAAAHNPPTLNAQQRRDEIMKLPEIARRQHAADQQLAELQHSIERLALTHHALAAEAQGNNPKPLKSKLEELAAAGNDLGKFYSSLPSK